MIDDLLKKYANLVVKTAINIQKGQILVITSPIDCAYFTRILAEKAYKEGAGDVVINWTDEKFQKIRFSNAPEEVFDEYPEWQKELFLVNVRKGAAFISISSSDPELMKDVEPSRISKAVKTAGIAIKEYRERLMSHKNPWCVISVPTAPWAMKVFPDLTEDQAVAKLWETIFKSIRVDKEDPVDAWNEHKNNLRKRVDFLNSKNFRFLHYKNSIGTDLTIELPENHIWHGGSHLSPEGVEYIANMPTEEVFTLPKKNGVNGTVVSSMPLNHNGNLIDGFSLTFKDGKIIDFSADKGYANLKELIDTDEGAAYLGEVALVPYDSPISNMKILFYNTLFDENASCHLAVGNAYPVCIKNGENMNKSDLTEAGVNSSLIHVDFMIGTYDLDIAGTTWDGEELCIFKNGNFAI